jgi:hypothetical protein
VDHSDTLTQAEWTRRTHAAILAAQLLEDSQEPKGTPKGTDTVHSRAPALFASLPVGQLTGERIDRPKTGDSRAAERRQIVAQGERSEPWE